MCSTDKDNDRNGENDEDADDDSDNEAPTKLKMDKNLELLFDYTKFHIGVYLTLTTAYLSFTKVKFGAAPLTYVNQIWSWVAVAAFMLAGLAGGVIVSSITQTESLDSRSFLEKRIGMWNFKKIWFKARWWTWLEHTSFWAGLIAAILSIVCSTSPVRNPPAAGSNDCSVSTSHQRQGVAATSKTI